MTIARADLFRAMREMVGSAPVDLVFDDVVVEGKQVKGQQPEAVEGLTYGLRGQPHITITLWEDGRWNAQAGVEFLEG
jgi:hypothetical protein